MRGCSWKYFFFPECGNHANMHQLCGQPRNIVVIYNIIQPQNATKYHYMLKHHINLENIIPSKMKIVTRDFIFGDCIYMKHKLGKPTEIVWEWLPEPGEGGKRERCAHMGMVFRVANKVLCLNNSDGCASFWIYRNSHILYFKNLNLW